MPWTGPWRPADPGEIRADTPIQDNNMDNPAIEEWAGRESNPHERKPNDF